MAAPMVRQMTIMAAMPIRAMTTVRHWAAISFLLIKVPRLATSSAATRENSVALMPVAETISAGNTWVQNRVSSRTVTVRAMGTTPLVSLATNSPTTRTARMAIREP